MDGDSLARGRRAFWLTTGAGCVLGILSAGVFMMPVAVLLACAAALTPRPLIA